MKKVEKKDVHQNQVKKEKHIKKVVKEEDVQQNQVKREDIKKII